MVNKVCIVGGGIIGVTTALVALEKVPGIEVTIISEKFTPYTTGDGSSGFIDPFLIGKVSDERLKVWCDKTLKFAEEIAFSPDADEYGVGLLQFYCLYKNAKEIPTYLEVFPHSKAMNSRELEMFPSSYKFGISYMTFYVECKKLLPQLLKKIVGLGGKLIKEKVNSFEQLHGKYDVVINCTGIGAFELASDSEVFPIRGQVIRLKAPWLKTAVCGEGFYIIPNSDEIILGGIYQDGNWNLDVNAEDRRSIWEVCTELIPSLKKGKVLADWVGLRPGRCEPRMEREKVKTAKGDMEVIHNYGHAGAGVSTGYGCALEVVEILEEVLNDINLKKIVSNL